MTLQETFQSSFFRLREVGDVAVVTVTRSQLTEEENLEQLDFDFKTLAERFQIHRMVVDLASVTYLTSAAIGKLISLHRRLARMDGRLVLCSLQPQVSMMLATSHLLEYFTVAPNAESALGQFT